MGTVKYTGPVASFHCPTNADIRSLKVHFSPKQEGTGDPSPSNVRAITGWDGVEAYHVGKNMIPTNENNWEQGQIMSGGGRTNSTDTNYLRRIRTINKYPILPNTQYTLRWFGDIIPAFHQWKKDKTTYISDSGWKTNVSKIFTFTSNSDAYWIEFTCRRNDRDALISPSAVGTEVSIQLEEGSTATSYEPYRGSTTNYTFGVLGKNKLPIGTATFTRYKQYDLETPLLPGTYTISALINSNDTDESQSLILFEKAGKNDANVQVQLSRDVRTSRTLTLVNSCAKVYIYAAKSYASSADDEATWTDVQLELGSTATAYEPYDPNHTVYGGWVDLISGEVCEEYNHITLDSTSPFNNITTIDENTNLLRIRLYFNDITDKTIKDISTPNLAYFNYLKSEPVTTDSWNGYFTGGSINPRLTVYVQDSNITSIETFLNYLDVHPLEVCYELATPNTYSLAPTQLQTFLGHNNVWSNADYVEVEYDLHETQDILARKQFIMASQPHIEEASGAITTFTTDMASPLKECKIHFSPVQEGTGDPSPENVRPITGWTGVDVSQAAKNIINLDGNFYRFYPSGGKFVVTGSAYSTIIFPAPKTVIYYESPENAACNYAGLCDEIPDLNVPVYNALTMTNRKQTMFDNSDGHKYMFLTITRANETDITPFLDKKLVISLNQYEDTYSLPSGTTLPIDWSSAGTVYGGYVDLVKGEVVAEQKIIDLGNFNWTQRYAGGAYIPGLFYSGVISDKGVSGISLVCDRYPYQYNSKIDQTADKTINDSYQTRLQCVNIRDSDYNEYSAAEFRTAMSGVKCVYVLAEPIHYQIDTITLKTLRGLNNVWSNANGNIELSYWKY